MNAIKENILKPILTKKELIENLKSKNIKFKFISELNAIKYLKNNNNYYNLISYKNNFEKYYINGEFIDKYIDLDFAYLKDLAIIDYKLRLLLFDMIMDIEHYLKIKILNKIERIKEENGYNIVNLYLEKDYLEDERIHKSIEHKIGTNNYKKILSNNKLTNIPIWEFLEIITFGELVNFYEFYIHEYKLKTEYQDIYILKDIVKLRNAVCHNNNILNDLSIKDNHNPVNRKVAQFIKECNIGQGTRRTKLSNSRIRQITYTLYMFNKMITSEEVKGVATKKLNELFYVRIKRNKEYYNNNELLKSVYKYFDKIISQKYLTDIE